MGDDEVGRRQFDLNVGGLKQIGVMIWSPI